MTTKINNKIQKLRIAWALICRSASVDKVSNMVSIFNVIDEFTLSKTPPISDVLSGKMEDFQQKTKVNTDFIFVIQFERTNIAEIESFETKIKIKVTDPSGEVLTENEVPIIFEQGKKRVRSLISFDGILLTKSGTYIYTVSTKSPKGEKFEEQAHTTIDVKIFA